MNTSISVIVPAFNEEGNIEKTLESVSRVAAAVYREYEILVVDDASKDSTVQVVEGMMRSLPAIKLIRHERNLGFGASYRTALKQARFDYAALIPGDNEISEQSIEDIFLAAGTADIIIPFAQNQKIRPLFRRILSHLFTRLLNFLFGLRFRYYNGPALYRSSLAKKIDFYSDGFFFLAEMLIRSIKSGASFKEVGMTLTPRAEGRSKALSLKSFLSVCISVYKLWFLSLRGVPLGSVPDRGEACP